MNENERKQEFRKVELKLFNQIMRWEHDNKYSREYSDKAMQDRIKKLIQNSVTVEE